MPAAASNQRTPRSNTRPASPARQAAQARNQKPNPNYINETPTYGKGHLSKQGEAYIEEIVQKGYQLPNTITEASLKAEVTKIRNLEANAESAGYGNVNALNTPQNNIRTPAARNRTVQATPSPAGAIPGWKNLSAESQAILKELKDKNYELPQVVNDRTLKQAITRVRSLENYAEQRLFGPQAAT